MWIIYAVAVLVECCLNGSRRPGAHPRLPLTAGQLAGEAAVAVAAGARALHLHPRDGDGVETLSATWVDAAVVAVRSACPGVPVGLSTAAWIESDHERRLHSIRGWRALPDFCSVNLAEEGWEEVVQVLRSRGIGAEAGLAAPAAAEPVTSAGVDWTRVLIEPVEEEPEAAMARARQIDAALDRAQAAWPRLHHGSGPATWAVIRQALERGWDVRVGMEDVLELPDGSPARDNADLVMAAVALARGLPQD